MQRDIVNVKEAAEIISEKARRPISQDYIRELRRQGRLKAINEQEEGHTKAYLFWRSEVEQITIGSKRVRGIRNPRKKEDTAIRGIG